MGKIDEEKLIGIVKKTAIGLVITAALVFLLVSAKIFSVSQASPGQYEKNFSKLSVTEKNMVRKMKKTGEVQSKVIGTRRSTGGNGKFINEVEKNHRSDKKN